MSALKQRERALNLLGGEEGKVNDGHLFVVRNREKRPEVQYWVPVTGSQILSFASGSHDWKYLGPAGKPSTKAKLAKIEEDQAPMMGVRQYDPEGEDEEGAEELGDVHNSPGGEFEGSQAQGRKPERKSA